MSAPRPLRLLIGTLALAGSVKMGLALAMILRPDQPMNEALQFVRAAEAASPKTPAPAAAPQPVPAAQPVAQDCEMPEEMLDAIKRERELLATQKDELAQKQSETDLAAQKVADETKRLSELKGEVEALLARVEKAHTDDLDRLVKLYSTMKPKQAASIMNDLDIEVTVMVLGTMVERDAAPIMASMNPVRVQAISKILLERSKLPGDQNLKGIRLK